MDVRTSDRKRSKVKAYDRNTDNFCKYLILIGYKFNFRLKFLHFVYGSEKFLIWRKNAPVAPKANSVEKGPKMNEKDQKTLIRFVKMLRFEP